jgi:hypothetical protein
MKIQLVLLALATAVLANPVAIPDPAPVPAPDADPAEHLVERVKGPCLPGDVSNASCKAACAKGVWSYNPCCCKL